jgi:hypothetical protein
VGEAAPDSIGPELRTRNADTPAPQRLPVGKQAAAALLLLWLLLLGWATEIQLPLLLLKRYIAAAMVCAFVAAWASCEVSQIAHGRTEAGAAVEDAFAPTLCCKLRLRCTPCAIALIGLKLQNLNDLMMPSLSTFP